MVQNRIDDRVDEIMLFEIPIYCMPEDEFIERWDKIKKKLFNEFMPLGDMEENTKTIVQNIYFPKCIWKYNQIIGFITVSVTGQDVIFNIFCSKDKKYYVNSKTKHFIEYYQSLGNHFFASNRTEEDIKRKIREMLHRIKKDDLDHKFYIDDSTFNNILNFINIKQIMKIL